MENEKFKQYAEEFNKNKTQFVNKRLLESLIRMEERKEIEEIAYLKVLEMLQKLD